MDQKDVRKEVESHSSSITNVRIGAIKDVVWKLGYQVMSSKPHPLLILEFFSAIMEYYLETKDIYEDSKEIDEQVKAGNIIASRMRVTGVIGKKDMENLLQISLSLQHMINTSLQNMRYFFRLGKHAPKGIDAALKIFKQKVWEGKKDTEPEEKEDAEPIQAKAGK